MYLDNFHPAVSGWFNETFQTPTDCQAQAWAAIKGGKHTLISAPTGSGKTLAAFLAAIDELVRLGAENRLDGTTQVLYISPLKALSNDIQKNLQQPLEGINRKLFELGYTEVAIRSMVRTGDTPSVARAAMLKQPPHILVTTPESCYILLTSDGGATHVEVRAHSHRRRNPRHCRRQTRLPPVAIAGALAAFGRRAFESDRAFRHPKSD